MTVTNSKLLAAIMIILGVAILAAGVFTWIDADINGYLNTFIPISLGIIALGLCSMVGGFMGMGARKITCVFYIPLIIAASIFIAIIAYKIVF